MEQKSQGSFSEQLRNIRLLTESVAVLAWNMVSWISTSAPLAKTEELVIFHLTLWAQHSRAHRGHLDQGLMLGLRAVFVVKRKHSPDDAHDDGERRVYGKKSLVVIT